MPLELNQPILLIPNQFILSALLKSPVYKVFNKPKSLA